MGDPITKAQPIFDPKTHYRILLQGRMEAEWLKSLDSALENSQVDMDQKGDTTVVDVITDQAGIVGLVRRLHGMGMTILELNILAE